MRTGERGIELIKSFEQCRLIGYLPTPDDVPTIGWGHTGPEVKIGMTWTQEQADLQLALDVERFEHAVSSAVTVPLTQPEFDACVSLAFNIGADAFKKSTLVKKLNAGDFDGAAMEFRRWNKQSGRELAGLTRRRKAEYELFESTA